MVAPSPIIITPPVTLSLSNRCGLRANQSRAFAAASAQMLSEATHMVPNTRAEEGELETGVPGRVVDELGEERHEEHDGLRVGHTHGEAHAQRPTDLARLRPVCVDGLESDAGIAAMPDRLHTEPHDVPGTDHLEDGVGMGAGGDHGAEPDRDGQHLRHDAERVADDREQSVTPADREGPPDREEQARSGNLDEQRARHHESEPLAERRHPTSVLGRPTARTSVSAAFGTRH